jgi:hypothetical protein
MKNSIRKGTEYKYYTSKQITSIKNATTYKELLNVALEILHVMPKPIVQVCGPISTGGLGSIEKNLEVLDKTIKKLESQGYNVFGQIPYEGKMQEIKESYSNNIEAGHALLEEFYFPILKAGFIEKFFFIYGWESSAGARWEREQVKKLNISAQNLPEDFLRR